MILLRTCLRWFSTSCMIVVCSSPRFLLLILTYFERYFSSRVYVLLEQ